MTDPLPSTRHAFTAELPTTWAEVHARETVMRYRGAGAGRAVIVLEPPGDRGAIWPELLEALAKRRRVILPELHAVDGAAAEWLAGFLEGLGSRGVAVIAAEPYQCLALTLGDPDQVACVVLVPSAPDPTSAQRSAGAGSARRDGCPPLLVVPRELPASVALPLVLDFLDGAAALGAVPGARAYY
jgi:hypothetical protein